MKQLLQRLDSGETKLEETPLPTAGERGLVVAARASLVSAGTERMLVQFGRANLLDKVRSQPDRVRDVLDKMRTDGLVATADAVRSKLAMPVPLGYCSAGIVTEAGRFTPDFGVGTRVVTNGPHAEYVRVSARLAARIPDAVPFEHAAFTPLAAVALQGIRVAAPSLGEVVVVFGLGLVGQLAVQLLRANGCVVIGLDRDPERLALAARFGAEVINPAEDPVRAVIQRTNGIGADATLLTLATDADEPVSQAAEMTRAQGRLVLIGVTGLALKRETFYKKELRFAVSCSYGPGRYDRTYEVDGIDYPLPFVRWTAQRNFDAVLGLMSTGAIDPAPLISHRFRFAEAADAYRLLAAGAPSMGLLFEYDASAEPTRSARTVELSTAPVRAGAGRAVVVGAGNYAVRTLLPELKTAGFAFDTLVSGGGATLGSVARQFGFTQASTDTNAAIGAAGADSVFILTRHDSHAHLATQALEAGKHVFVEKPLALTHEELAQVERAARASGTHLHVGFNRRFAPAAVELRRALAGTSGPRAITLTMNAGNIPQDHWTQDTSEGGGRIVGEACHMVDLARSLVGHSITRVSVQVARAANATPVGDIAFLGLEFADGSIATVQYLANGSKRYPKERVEAHAGGASFVLDNWRKLMAFGASGGWSSGLGRKADKGHAAQAAAWFSAVRGGTAPIPLEELLEVSRWSIIAADLARTGGGVSG
jgi:predicted dehydrogenase/threonine dehydrogenase-like Zn-dependent dehydrogenase